MALLYFVGSPPQLFASSALLGLYLGHLSDFR